MSWSIQRVKTTSNTQHRSLHIPGCVDTPDMCLSAIVKGYNWFGTPGTHSRVTNIKIMITGQSVVWDQDKIKGHRNISIKVQTLNLFSYK